MAKKIDIFDTDSGFNLTTTATRCKNGHQWTYSGNLHLDLEGYPCDCGKVTFHTEECPCCHQRVQKHIPNG